MVERGNGFRPDQEKIQRPETDLSDAELAFFDEANQIDPDTKDSMLMGPETADEDLIEFRKETARGVMEKLRQHPITKPLFRVVAVMMGVSTIGYGTMNKERGESDPELEEIAQALEDPGVEYEFRKILFEELLDSQQVLSETEARYGRDVWSQPERIEYSEIPTLEGRFEYLHKDDAELIEHYRSPEGRIKSFGSLFETMSMEFSRSSLPREFAKTCINDAPEVLKDLPEQEAVALYKEFSQDLSKKMGLAHTRELGLKLIEQFPADHPVHVQVLADGWTSEEMGEMLKPSRDNSAVFDQGSGRILMHHTKDGKKTLLDVFPGNGGIAKGVAWEKGMPAHTPVRTPDGNYTFARSLEKKSYSWRNSWVLDTAPLRWSADKTEVEYQDVDGKWRQLTGVDGEFTVWGAAEKPFKDKGKSKIYNWSSKKLADGSMQPPNPFTVQDALGPDGELRVIWDRNDFGPKAIEINDQKGERMTIIFHSSPSDEGPEQFLGNSHGCVRMKPADVESMAGYLEKSSKIRISSFDEVIM